jgi:hypothetical protein
MYLQYNEEIFLVHFPERIVVIAHRVELATVVSTMCKDGGLHGYRTNHSLRTSAATRLYQAGVDEQLITEVTGSGSSCTAMFELAHLAVGELLSSNVWVSTLGGRGVVVSITGCSSYPFIIPYSIWSMTGYFCYQLFIDSWAYANIAGQQLPVHQVCQLKHCWTTTPRPPSVLTQTLLDNNSPTAKCANSNIAGNVQVTVNVTLNSVWKSNWIWLCKAGPIYFWFMMPN